jgi:radical SAM family uncharacterized protein/radical SAM-linked protein
MNVSINIDSILPLVKKPGRYIGAEFNALSPDPSSPDLAFALVFPDLYEIGMSHQGLQLLYHILNQEEGLRAERCFVPDMDMEAQLRQQGLPLFSLESRRPLASFDVVGITLPYELCYSNILTLLDLAGISLRAAERQENAPLVIGGGSCSLNPEPVADFFDLIVLGDGEEVLLEIAACLRQAKQEQLSRTATLHRLAALAGVYVPAFFQPEYEGQQLTALVPLKEGYERVQRRIVSSLPPMHLLERPLVPLVKPVHDRLGVEIARGCTRGCRFCQAGILYRPVRERSVDQIMTLVDQGIRHSGFDELALLSLSTGDYSCLPELLTRIMDRLAEERVSISLPSMRVGTLTPEVIAQIQRVRKTGFTLAPEAGSERLRQVINKGITEEDLLAGCRDAFAAGWSLIKLYFMIGLPTETQEDLEGIAALALRAKKEAKGKRVDINVALSSFVPKAHTPFQWCEQISLEKAREHLAYILKTLPTKGFKLKWHDPEQAFLEGVFSRGDRRLSHLIEAAWRKGCRLDGWSEHFSLARWQQAADELGINLSEYLRARSFTEVLPWDHLRSGVDRRFLEEEYAKALNQHYTPDCRRHGCQHCGLCDFKTIKPLIQPPSAPLVSPPVSTVKPPTSGPFRYRVRYARVEEGRFIGHLELLQLVFRILHRAKLPLLYSQGFNPSPKVSFSPALPVGVESELEFFEMDLAAPLPKGSLEALNQQVPRFMRIHSIDLAKKKAPVAEIVTYQCRFPQPVKQMEEQIQAFQAADHCTLERLRKGKRQTLDLKYFVQKIERGQAALSLRLDLLHPQAAAGVGPRELIAHIFALDAEAAQLVRILKVNSREA